jgi:hypothetical protein
MDTRVFSKRVGWLVLDELIEDGDLEGSCGGGRRRCG